MWSLLFLLSVVRLFSGARNGYAKRLQSLLSIPFSLGIAREPKNNKETNKVSSWSHLSSFCCDFLRIAEILRENDRFLQVDLRKEGNALFDKILMENPEKSVRIPLVSRPIQKGKYESEKDNIFSTISIKKR